MMTEEQKYLFDLQGYLVVSQILSMRQVDLCNRELDRLIDTPANQFPGNAVKQEKSDVDSIHGTDIEIRNITECGKVFEELIDHPALLEYLKQMISHPRIRMTHAYTIIREKGDATPGHRGRIPIMGQCQYRFEGGMFHCNMIKVVYCLTDLEPSDGGFSVIPGSHKSNFSCPYFVKGDPEKSRHPDDVPVMVEISAKAGDAIIFTEDLTHGSKTNHTGKQRRNLYYTYQPCYFPDWMEPASEQLMERLTPARRELMAPSAY